MNKADISKIITIATELKNKKNNEFFIIKGMIIERSLNKKDCN